MSKQPEQWAIKQHLEKYPKCEWICLHTNLINLGEEQMPEYDNPTNKGLLEAAKPLIEYLNNNYHPHCKIIVDHTTAEVVEGQQLVHTKEFLRD